MVDLKIVLLIVVELQIKVLANGAQEAVVNLAIVVE